MPIRKLVILFVVHNIYKSTVSPHYSGWGYVPSLPVNPENPRIIDAVLKCLFMIYMLKYTSKTHSKDSFGGIIGCK